jgi:hypothetical protein
MSQKENEATSGRRNSLQEKALGTEKEKGLASRSAKNLAKLENRRMDLPGNIHLPFFSYGAMKPGLPGFQNLREHVETKTMDEVLGQLLVRDGLPLLRIKDRETIEGWLLKWKCGHEQDAYSRVCEFEPRKHYQWTVVTLQSGEEANLLEIREPKKGNPQHLFSRAWRLQDDPAFGPGLDEVERMLQEAEQTRGGRSDLAANWQPFFRAQMGYLLLWSIIERLSALCVGPNLDPMQRIKFMSSLPGIAEAVRHHVQRIDKIADSRDPKQSCSLDADNAKKSFLYYYQVRSNLSHRGKGHFQEFYLVRASLRELLGITRDYLNSIESLGQGDVLQAEATESLHQIHKIS